MVSKPDRVLILASASPRRRELLASLGVRFEVLPCPLPEPTSKPDRITNGAWAEALACFKASVVAERHSGRWVLGADTIVVCARQLLGKPRDIDDARQMLELQAGRAAEVITGVCLTCRGEAVHRLVGRCGTLVWMRDAPDERQAYLDSGDWWGKAGAYGIQTVGDRLVARIEGSFSNVVGLPLELTQRLLRQAKLLPTTPPPRSNPVV